MHDHDWLERLRHAFVPVLGELLAEVNDDWDTDLYATLRTLNHEFAFVWTESQDRFERRLHDLGFVRNPLAAWKHLETGVTERGSWAWRGRPPRPFGTASGWERDPWADYQLHVILFEVEEESDATAVFAHWEYSWKTHPVKHYRGVLTEPKGRDMLRTMFREKVDRYEELAMPPESVQVLDR